jgi:hypothetical protein
MAPERVQDADGERLGALDLGGDAARQHQLPEQKATKRSG